MPPQIVDIIGFAASALVFLTFCMQTLLPLRFVATVSNIFFIAYGIFAGLIPILVLHLLLLPMNLWRLVQQLQSRRHMHEAFETTPDLNMLLPFMTSKACAAGEEIFQRGAQADRLFIVLKGEVMVEQIGKVIPAGGIFGEIGLFSLAEKRTATVRAVGPATIGSIDRATLLRIYRDYPAFALALTKLIASRHAENQNDLLEKLAAAQ